MIPAHPIKLTPGLKKLRSLLGHLRTAPERTLFLDIETTGLSRHYHRITVIGFMLDGRYDACVTGDCMEELRRALGIADTVVTFNGSGFDIPFLRQEHPDLKLPERHLDLRYACRYAGLSGGQKNIEAQLGIERGIDIDGAGAVLLWHRYVAGDSSALEELVRYNYLDVAGMATLLDHVDSVLLDDEELFRPVAFGQRIKALEKKHKDNVLPARARGFVPRRFEDLFDETPASDATIVGLDLTGSEKRPTGAAISRGRFVCTALLRTDDEILDYARSALPDVVSIDSPLSLPSGRVSVFDDDPGRDEFGIMRKSERLLKRRGINVYPCLLPSMQRLTLRGMSIADKLRKEGIPVIESYPGAAQDIVGIARKGAGLPYLVAGLKAFGYVGDFDRSNVSHDELDAITCCMVGSFFLSKKFEALGFEEEDALIIPDLKPASLPQVIGVSGRIAAGKTTFSQALERNGFGYLRYSQIIDEVIVERGLVPQRSTRQLVGREINEGAGQRWLGKRLLSRMGESGRWVVDGLRFREDHAFWAEHLGSNFIHIHIEATPAMRMDRYCAPDMTPALFQTIDEAIVEREIDSLMQLADRTIQNHAAIADLENEAGKLVREIVSLS